MKKKEYNRVTRILVIVNFVAFMILMRVLRNLGLSTKDYLLLIVSCAILVGTMLGTFSIVYPKICSEQNEKKDQEDPDPSAE